jgi:hypothetical protein
MLKHLRAQNKVCFENEVVIKWHLISNPITSESVDWQYLRHGDI